MAIASADQPMAMSGLDEEMSRHYGLLYDNKSSAFHEDICTVWRSMCKKSLQKATKSERCNEENGYPTLPKTAFDHGQSKDLADVHHERALNAGKLNRDRGRRWRKRNYHRSKQEIRKVSEWVNIRAKNYARTYRRKYIVDKHPVGLPVSATRASNLNNKIPPKYDIRWHEGVISTY